MMLRDRLVCGHQAIYEMLLAGKSLTFEKVITRNGGILVYIVLGYFKWISV